MSIPDKGKANLKTKRQNSLGLFKEISIQKVYCKKCVKERGTGATAERGKWHQTTQALRTMFGSFIFIFKTLRGASEVFLSKY